MSPRSRSLLVIVVVALLAASAWWLLRVGPTATTSQTTRATNGSRSTAASDSSARDSSSTSASTQASASDAPVRVAKLSGRVVTARGEPAAGAFVAVERLSLEADGRASVVATVAADTDGAFVFELPAGAYVALATLDGLTSDRSATKSLAPGSVHEDLVLVLEPGASLVLTVRDQSDGHALSQCRADGVGQRIAAVCDHAGRIRLGPLAPGPLSLRVSAPGYAPKETAVVLTRRARLTADLSLTKGAVVSGRVVDPDKAPVAGARVRTSHYAISGLTPAEVFAVTDDSGAFLLDGVAPGRVTLLATSPGWAEASSDELKLVGGDKHDGLELVLSTGGAVAGRVVNAQRGGVEGATVEALRLVDRVVAATDVTTAGGAFRLDGLQPGSYTVSAASGHARALAQAVTVDARDETELELVLGAQSLSGRVVDSAGAPVAGAWVSAVSQLSSGLSEVSTTSDDEGRFLFDGLVGEPFRVKARAEGRGVAEVRGLSAGAETELVLAGAGSVEGFVGSDNGRGLESFEVVVTPSGPAPVGGMAGRFRVLKLLSPDGTFTIEELPAGRYEVRAEAVDHLEASKVVDVEADRVSRVDLRLRAGATASGRVLRGDEPASGCLVMGRAATAGDGSFQIAGLPPRRQFLWVRCGEEEAGGARVDLSSGRATNVELHVRPMPDHFRGDDFGGIGASLRAMRDGSIRVMSIFEGGPAFYAGLRDGDEIVTVDGWPVSGHPIMAVIERIRGPLGQPVVLEVRRPPGGAVFRVVAERSRIATN